MMYGSTHRHHASMNATPGIDSPALGNLDSGSLRTRLASAPLLPSESNVDWINV